MYASKENCRKARNIAMTWLLAHGRPDEDDAEFQFLAEFFAAAINELPANATFESGASHRGGPPPAATKRILAYEEALDTADKAAKEKWFAKLGRPANYGVPTTNETVKEMTEADRIIKNFEERKAKRKAEAARQKAEAARQKARESNKRWRERKKAEKLGK